MHDRRPNTGALIVVSLLTILLELLIIGLLLRVLGVLP